MTIILFLVDTSASMNQRTYLGTTLLDIAKGAVETFMKIRSRDPNSRWDRYMLLTFEEPPGNVKAGWKESHATFIRELKHMQASGLTMLGAALKHTFDLLNVNRMTSGIDTYGQGRCPFYLEPAIIICITDGKKLTSTGGVQLEVNLPMNFIVPGSELTKEPFRWDQRLFSISLNMPAVPPPETSSTYIPPAEDSPIDVMCEVMGGRSYAVSTHRMMMAALESLIQKCQSGVVINFEKFGVDPPPLTEEDKNEEKKRAHTPPSFNLAWQNCRKLIFVPRSAQKGFAVGHWPIPESFWPDLNSPMLPARSSHPVVRFSCMPCEAMVVDNFPFDKYELEPSPLTQYILERRQPNVVWQCFVSNSAKYSDIGHPFGYLKASTSLTAVNMFVMPYNYPVLLPLLDDALCSIGKGSIPAPLALSGATFGSCDLRLHCDWRAGSTNHLMRRSTEGNAVPHDDLAKVHKMKPTQKWRSQFDSYLKSMPVYYAVPLRRAMSRMGAPNLVPEGLDSCLSYSVVSYLKKLKNQAKMEYDRVVASVGQKVAPAEGIKVTARTQTSILQRKDFNQLLKHFGSDMSALKQEVTDYSTFTLAAPDPELQPQVYRNPFDIPRKGLLHQIRRMRENFYQHIGTTGSLQDQERVHNIPMQDMGNYQDFLKKHQQPLREIETTPLRMHTFGNPFKVNKNLMIDEADEAMPGQTATRKRSSTSSDLAPGSPRPNKRKPGPLPKDVPVRSLMSPAPSEEEEEEEEVVTEEETEDIHVPDPIFTDHNGDDGVMDYDLKIDLNHVYTIEDDEETVQELANHLADGNRNHVKLKLPEMLTNQNGGEADIVSNALKDTNVLEYNRHLKQIVVKEVKRPGKNYDNLFNQLNLLQGTLDIKCTFVQDIVQEALRFKKRMLADMLSQFEQSMVKVELRKQNSTQTPPSR